MFGRDVLKMAIIIHTSMVDVRPSITVRRVFDPGRVSSCCKLIEMSFAARRQTALLSSSTSHHSLIFFRRVFLIDPSQGAVKPFRSIYFLSVLDLIQNVPRWTVSTQSSQKSCLNNRATCVRSRPLQAQKHRSIRRRLLTAKHWRNSSRANVKHMHALLWKG